MLTYTITADTITLSDQARIYIEKRFAGFDRFVGAEQGQELGVTVRKVTAHTREDSFRVEVKFKLHTRDFFAVGTAGDIHAAVDMAKEELMREVTHSNQKRRTLFHRGARKIKNLVKGFYSPRKQ